MTSAEEISAFSSWPSMSSIQTASTMFFTNVSGFQQHAVTTFIAGRATPKPVPVQGAYQRQALMGRIRSPLKAVPNEKEARELYRLLCAELMVLECEDGPRFIYAAKDAHKDGRLGAIGHTKLTASNACEPWMQFLAPYLRAVGSMVPLVPTKARELTHLLPMDGTGQGAMWEAGFWFFAQDEECRHYLVAGPEHLEVDNEWRLHSLDGPCFKWLGVESFALHGAQVNRETIEHPENEKLERVIRSAVFNAEYGSALLELYGPDRAVAQLRADDGLKTREDERGILIGDKRGKRGNWPWQLLFVKDGTERMIDGKPTRKTYVLTVPIGMKTPTEAVAWTFDVKPKEYAPEVET